MKAMLRQFYTGMQPDALRMHQGDLPPCLASRFLQICCMVAR